MHKEKKTLKLKKKRKKELVKRSNIQVKCKDNRQSIDKKKKEKAKYEPVPEAL